MTKDKLIAISATLKREDKTKFNAFCLEKDMRSGNTMRALIVWFKGLTWDSKKKFISKYLKENRIARDSNTTSTHVYLPNKKEKKAIVDTVRELNYELDDPNISFTTILLSLIKWFQELNETSLAGFIEKYYLPGTNNTLKAIEKSAKGKEVMVEV